jgi:hypothetical protein
MSATADPLSVSPLDFDIAKHDGEITLTSPKTGDHRTFRVRTVRRGKLEGHRIVSLLTGPNNESDYEGFGFIVDRDGSVAPGTIAVWTRFRGKDGVESVYEKYASMLRLPAYWAAKGVQYRVSLRCRRCGRLLTHPESIISGYGPECIKKSGV